MANYKNGANAPQFALFINFFYTEEAKMPKEKNETAVDKGRAVVSYDKIFLMDPETLIKEEILVEPQCFVIIKKDENGEPTVLEAVTETEISDLLTGLEAWGRIGLKHEGANYDYNLERCGMYSLDLSGYCSNHAWSSKLVDEMYGMFHLPDDYLLSHPFDNYGFEGEQSFLVYRFPIAAAKSNLPGAKGSVILEVKPIDFCVHAENLQLEAWKKHQASLGLLYLTLREWPKTSAIRKIITELDYPRFIDPEGVMRARWDPMFSNSFRPEEAPEIIDV